MDGLSDVRNGIKAGCSINGSLINHLICADDTVVFRPSLFRLQHLAHTTHTFISMRKLDLNINKTQCAKVQAGRVPGANPRTSVKIKGSTLDLWMNINTSVMCWQTMSMVVSTLPKCIRSNSIVINFRKCDIDTKFYSYRSFCTSFNCMSIRSSFDQRSLNKLKVCFNNGQRTMTGAPRRSSASAPFVRHSLASFQELRREAGCVLLQRLRSSSSMTIKSIVSG